MPATEGTLTTPNSRWPSNESPGGAELLKLKTSASANFLLPGLGIHEIVAQVSAAGFHALEFQWLGPADAEQFVSAIENSSLEVALINFDVSDFVGGGAGWSGVPGRKAEFEAALEQAFHNARVLGAKVAHLGPCRVPNGVHRKNCVAQMVENARRALDRFSPLPTRLSIEALNRTEFPDVLIGSPDEALEVIEAVGDPRLVLQYDIYHGARDGRNVPRDLESLLGRVGHLQFADCPGRHEPGTGEVDFAECFAILRSLGYEGYVGAEYKPSKEFSNSLGWMALLGS